METIAKPSDIISMNEELYGTVFTERLEKGQVAERLALEAIEAGLFKHKGCGYGPTVTETEWNPKRWEQISANKVLGDLWFMDMSGKICRIDVKSGRWIAKDSIENFTTANSYYFLNAGTLTGSYVYLIFRFDEEMKAWIQSLPLTQLTNKDGMTDGYVIDYDDIPDRLNQNIVEIDPIVYHKHLVNHIDFCQTNNIPSFVTREK